MGESLEKLKVIISGFKSENSQQTNSTSDGKQTTSDNIFSSSGLNSKKEEWDEGDSFKNAANSKDYSVETLDFSVKNKEGKSEKDEQEQSEKLILNGDNADKITKYLQSKIDTTTLPDNANLDYKRLVVNDKGEVTALSIKLTDKNGNPIGNVEYDTDGNIKHISQIKYLEDGKFKIDEKYYDKNGKEIKSKDKNKEKEQDVYNIDDIKEVLNIINGSKEYNMLLDANSDGIIDIKDIKNITSNIATDIPIDKIKKKNLENLNNDYLADVDHKIGVSKQGNIGDCWILATINSLSYTEKGQQIIKDAITTNDDGTYTVNFQGVDTSITISDAELQQIKELGVYSTGDDDVLLMEIATEKVMDLIKDGKIDAPDFLIEAAADGKTSITGGWLRDMMYLLTGASSSFARSNDEIESTLNKLKNNPEEYAAFMAFNPNESGKNPVVKDVNGKNVELITGHAWSIKSVDGDTVTIVNPWDSKNSYTIPKSELMKHISTINFSNLSQYEGKKECSKNIRYNEDGSDIARIQKRDKNGNVITVTEEDEEDDNYTRQVITFKKHGNISEMIETQVDKDGNIKSISITENEYDKSGNLIRTTKKNYNGSGLILSSDESVFKKDDKVDETEKEKAK